MEQRSEPQATTRGPAPVVLFEGLTKVYKGSITALDGVNLAIPEGQVFGLLGRNGAGKTTALEILATLRRPTDGRASVSGMDVRKKPMEVRRRLAVLLETTLPPRPHWTVEEYLQFFTELRGVPAPDEALLSYLGLGDLRRRPTGALSAGQRRRVELARVFSSRAEVLLLDEPTKELDLPGKRDIWNAVGRYVEEAGVTVILSSHDILEIQELCESAAVLRDGRVALQLTKADMARDPRRIEGSLREAME